VIFISLVLFYRAKKGGLVVLGPRKLVGPGLTCRFWELPATLKKYQPILEVTCHLKNTRRNCRFTCHYKKIPANFEVYQPL